MNQASTLPRVSANVCTMHDSAVWFAGEALNPKQKKPPGSPADDSERVNPRPPNQWTSFIKQRLGLVDPLRR